MNLKKALLFLLSSLTFCLTNLAQASPDWFRPFPPFRIAGNLYYVGTEGLASYLVATPQGNILINTDYAANVPMIKASIEKLGFKFSDIKIILISHAHSDHAGGSALVKAKTGAKYMVMDADVSVVESGGKTDFLFGNEPKQQYQPTAVDRVLHDGDQVKLGNTVLVAHLTPGHSKGCVTWTMQVTEASKIYNVVIVGGVSINPGTRFFHNTTYPKIAQDFEYMWRVLNALPCDIFLGAHGIYFELKDKYERMQHGEANPFVDADGYRKFIAQKEKDFRIELAKQKASK